MDSASENPLNGRFPRMEVLNSGSMSCSMLFDLLTCLSEVIALSTLLGPVTMSYLGGLKWHQSDLRQLENNNSAKKGEPIDGEPSEGADLSGYSKIREDGFMLFKNLCKLPLKFSSQEHADDNILLRGKVLPLELLKVIMDNAGPIWRSP
ncbi:hypothetical protein P3L10_019456 [Capsicum annuum]